jgi:hypothetical protein
MKTKILFVLISLGTFNYFLASTYDWKFPGDPSTEDERKISVQIQEVGDLWALSGNVSLLTDIAEGELKLLIFPYGTCSIEEDPYCFTSHQPLGEIFIKPDGTFFQEHLEQGRYTIIVLVEKADKTYVKMEAMALGAINLEDFLLNEELDIQIAISYPTKSEVVYR